MRESCKYIGLTNNTKDTNITKSPIIASFMAVAMVFSSPAGHDFAYQGLLRLWFAKSWLNASIEVGRPISFQSFRDNAEIFAYNENPDVFIQNMKLLKDDFSFCLPFVETDNKDNKNPNTPINSVACHSATQREEKKKDNRFNI